MDWQYITQIIQDHKDWAWRLLLLVVFCVFILRLFFAFRKSNDGRSESLFESEDQAKSYEYWRDGYDLTKVQPIDFLMSFPTKAKAQEAFFGAGRNLKIESHTIELKDGRWHLRLTIEVLPSLKEMQSIRGDLQKIADYLDGTYDGWQPKEAEA